MDSSGPFPANIVHEIRKLPGNDCCCGCFSMDTDWACVLFGTLLCLDCAGRHRSLGVKVSFVRSIYLDAWSLKHVEIMRHGGNGRFKLYMQQCNAGFKDSNYGIEEYLRLCQSDQAEEYKDKLMRHVEKFLADAAAASAEDSIFTTDIVEVYDEEEFEELDSFGNIVITSPGRAQAAVGSRAASGVTTPLVVDTSRNDFSNAVPTDSADKTYAVAAAAPAEVDPDSHACIAAWVGSRSTRFSAEFPAGPMGMSIAADTGGAPAAAGHGGISSFACVTKVKPEGAAADRGVCVGDVVVHIGSDSSGADSAPIEYREVTRLVSTLPRPVTIHFARQIAVTTAAAGESSPSSSHSAENSPHVHSQGSADSCGKSSGTPHKRRHSFRAAGSLSRSNSSSGAHLEGVVEGALSTAAAMSGSGDDAALEELEDVLLTPQERTFSRGATNRRPANTTEATTAATAPATAATVSEGDTAVGPASDATAAPPATAPLRAAASGLGRSRVPFAPSEPEEEVEEEVEEPVVRGSGDGHDLSILMEQVAQVPRPPQQQPQPQSAWGSVPPRPPSIQIRQQSANSWEYEVLFLTKPYGFTLSKSSAPETHPNLNSTPHPAVVTRVLGLSKAAQQGVSEGDTVVAVNRVPTPTYESVLAEIDAVHKRCAAARMQVAAAASSSSNSGAPVGPDDQVPVIFLLRRSVSYIVASTSSILATESKKLLSDTILLSRTFLEAFSPSPSVSASANPSPGVSRTSTPGVGGAGANNGGAVGGASASASVLPPFMRPMDSGRRQSSLGSGTASIVINTSSMSPATQRP